MKLSPTAERYKSVILKANESERLQDVADFYQISYPYLTSYLCHCKKVFPEIYEKHYVPRVRKKTFGVGKITYEEILSLRMKGFSMVKIAKKLGVKSGSLYGFFSVEKKKREKEIVKEKTYSLNSSEEYIYDLVKNNKLSEKDIVGAYCKCVREEWEDFWMHYNIEEEFKKSSEIYNKKITPCIKQWWTRNLGQLIMKKKITLK